MIRKVQGIKLAGCMVVPPSKSDAQRAILCAALAEGTSFILNPGKSKDVLSMLTAVQSLGAEINENEREIQIKGFVLEEKNVLLNIGESGLALRLLTPVCSALGGSYNLSGEASIVRRQHRFFEQYLSGKSLVITSNEGRLPIRLTGRLSCGRYEVDGSESSQFISGLLMALPLLDGVSELYVNQLKSRPYVEMTLHTLHAFGIQIERITDYSYRIPGGQRYQACQYTVEGDWSSASYWIVASALGHAIKLSGLKLDSIQADQSILRAIEATGGVWRINELNELEIIDSKLRAFHFDATDCPDLFPALVTLAAFCDGVSVVKGVSRLSNKESNRGEVLQSEFSKLGVRIELEVDEMIIHGGEGIKSGVVNSHGDHRIAMCLAIAGSLIKNGVEIEQADVVDKSYPNFWSDLQALIH